MCHVRVHALTSGRPGLGRPSRPSPASVCRYSVRGGGERDRMAVGPRSPGGVTPGGPARFPLRASPLPLLRTGPLAFGELASRSPRLPHRTLYSERERLHACKHTRSHPSGWGRRPSGVHAATAWRVWHRDGTPRRPGTPHALSPAHGATPTPRPAAWRGLAASREPCWAAR